MPVKYFKLLETLKKISSILLGIEMEDHMDLFKVVADFDPELKEFLDKEIERQKNTLSFIPDENSISPVCASVQGSVWVSSSNSTALGRTDDLEKLVEKRLCEVFNAPCASVRTVTIEAASRIVFNALTERGDVVMSLDLRKKEHCNSEHLAFRFVNFGIDNDTRELNLNEIEKKARECKPRLIVVSPINYSANIDYQRLAKIAKSVGAYLWCDISQSAGLIASGVFANPMPYADVVTFSTHGSMQGPQSAVILCQNEIYGDIKRAETISGHTGLLSSELAGLAVRLTEMKSNEYKEYNKSVVGNSIALADGLKAGGVKLVDKLHGSHLVMVDAQSCALSARGIQELLSDAGIHVRITNVLTSDPKVKFDAVRFSTLPLTTRGITPEVLKDLGKEIATVLLKPEDDHVKALKEKVLEVASKLKEVDPKFVQPILHQLLD